MLNKGNRNFRIAVVIACVLAVVVIYDRVQPSTACISQSSQPEVLLGSGTDADVVTKLLLRASGLKSRVTITDPPFTWVYDTKPECANFISLLASNNGFAASMETQLFRTILFEQCKQLDANGRAPLVVDVGGNAGYFTAYAAAMGCRVIAFEPFPHMMNFLELHVSLNNFGDRVTAVPAAVSSAPGDAWLNPVCTDSGLSHLTNSAGAGGNIRVRTVRLSDVINEDVLLLKIDVEGFEDHVFKGMEGLLKKHKVKNIICETKKTGDVAYKIATINSLINRNYSVYSYPEYYGNDAPYPVYTNLPEKVLIPVSTLASNDWIPHEDMFYTIQKDSLKFE